MDAPYLEGSEAVPVDNVRIGTAIQEKGSNGWVITRRGKVEGGVTVFIWTVEWRGDSA